MQLRSRIWLPSSGEERHLNLITLVLILLLLAAGFEILKFPATVAPDRPPLAQLLGLAALAMLNMVLTWAAARDDYVRFGHGFPRALATFAILSALFSAAFLARGLFDGTFAIDPGQPLEPKKALTVLIGGQFAALAFFATYLIRKGDAAAVRSFKRSMRAIRDFAAAFLDSRLDDESFDAAYARVDSLLAGMPDAARTIERIVVPEDAAFALEFAGASERVGDIIAKAPTQSAARETVERNAAEALALLAGRTASHVASNGAST